jgi:hypothetical protein
MRRQYFIVIALFVLLMLFVVSVAWNALAPIGPAYQGKRLSSWLVHLVEDEVISTNDVANDQAAIRQIGTNALPTLLIMASRRDSWLKREILSAFPDEVKFRLRLFTDDDYYRFAREGFQILGPIAKPIIPVLIEHLNNKNPQVRDVAADLLGSIGPSAEDAVPALVERFKHERAGEQRGIINALGSIRRQPAVVVPLLTTQLDDSNTTKVNRISALIALAGYGSDATQAVSAVERFLNDPDPPTRIYATNALEQIEPKFLRRK